MPLRTRWPLSELLATADAALYRVKEHGRNRVELAGRRDKDDSSAVVVRIA